MKPNVLLVVFDTARADAFEPYGGPRGATPALSQLASRGVAAPTARSSASWTVPSHASMFTGLLPRATGTSHPTGENLPAEYHRAIRSLAHRFLPEVLHRAGYETGGVSSNAWVRPTCGFGTGFERFETVATERQSNLHGDSLRGRAQWMLEGVRAENDDGARAAEEVLRRWVDEPRERPFFWFVNLVECHSPYLPPKPYNDLGVLDRALAADEARRFLNMEAIWRACLGGLDVPEPALRRMRHLYQRSMGVLDDWLARVLQLLDQRGLLDETLVLVTSDHGENLGEEGLMGHGFSLDERLLRVPFVACGPGAEAFADLRSLSELPRRLAGPVGIDEHPWHDGLPDIDGVAAAQYDPPAPRGHPKVAEAMAEWGLGDAAALRLTGSIDCAIDGDWKLVVREGLEEFVDLSQDPLELGGASDSASVPSDVANRLRQALAHPDFAASLVDPQEPATDPSVDTGGEDADELQRLEDSMKLLGYM